MCNPHGSCFSTLEANEGKPEVGDPIVSPFFAPDGQLRQAGDEERRFSQEQSVATGQWGGSPQHL